jgi:glycosyltransferase involved in cell wall biosynthesis
MDFVAINIQIELRGYIKMKEISFVVIAYNEEKHILETLRSILDQKSLSNYEVIVVNDGSKDNTSKLVHEFINKKNYVKLINNIINKGRGFARQIGILNAKGKYIAFVDADIILPKNWLEKVLPQMKFFDAAGGIAIPDGDSTYICQKFLLNPKPLPHTYGITGSNSIYKSNIFNKIIVDPNLRGGEDVDILLKMVQSGCRIKLLDNLIVSHREDITFKKSLKRMFSFGKGATNLLNFYKKIRIPDLSFFLFVILFVNAIYFSIYRNFYFIYLFVIYPLFVSYLHLFKKFKFEKAWAFVFGGLFNYFMILSYFIGRIAGYFSKE